MQLKKISLALSLIMLTSTLSGCNVKIIEKAPEKESTESTIENIGTIEINSNDTEEHFQEQTSEEETSSTEETSSQTFETRTPETETTIELGENQQEMNGVIFNMGNQEMYVKTNTKLYSNAKLTGTAASGVSKGSKLTVYGVSVDKKIAMIRLTSGTIYYMAYEYLSPDEVSYEDETSETQQSTSETSSQSQSSSSSEKSSSSQAPSSTSSEKPSSQSSSQAPSSSKSSSSTSSSTSKEPAKPNGGIAYPNNPSSTSVNFGITFADETFKAKVVSTTTMNSGPGKVLNSTGYTVIETFDVGTIVNCTGIGANGYIRVVLADGTIGFILNTDLVRQ